MKNNIIICVFGALAFLMSCGGASTAAPATTANSDNATTTDPTAYKTTAYTNASGYQLAKSYDPKGGFLTSEGPLYNGIKEGAWLTYYAGRDTGKIKTITNYHKDMKTGIEIEFASNGSLEKRVDYDGGVLDGIYAEYKYNRPLKYAEYSNGEIDGMYKTYYSNGKVQQSVEYTKGQKNGKSLFYNEEGQIIMEFVYKDDEKVSGGKVTPPPTSQPK